MSSPTGLGPQPTRSSHDDLGRRRVMWLSGFASPRLGLNAGMCPIGRRILFIDRLQCVASE